MGNFLINLKISIFNIAAPMSSISDASKGILKWILEVLMSCRHRDRDPKLHQGLGRLVSCDCARLADD